MPFLKAKDLQEKIGVSRTTINNWMKQGMPHEKLGKIVRFNEEEVMQWLRNRNNETE